MTDLEQILDNDPTGAEVKKLKETLFQAQTSVKRKLDQGCDPQQYQILTKQHKAYIAAQTVLENYVPQQS
ncbi:EscE/YscE/SsaE family type III secretion system needle protein co-chaperone [Vibrio bivalvicida]|uniref:EscE/YscE/SsaE family type III secretion system needle protein co-chaperone n=1 Tax=Vibrio bivalvicida TaxID=1276888 RepID=A0ABV4MGU1_9VIBR